MFLNFQNNKLCINYENFDKNYNNGKCINLKYENKEKPTPYQYIYENYGTCGLIFGKCCFLLMRKNYKPPLFLNS
jgi:hypothetical protein